MSEHSVNSFLLYNNRIFITLFLTDDILNHPTTIISEETKKEPPSLEKSSKILHVILNCLTYFCLNYNNYVFLIQ